MVGVSFQQNFSFAVHGQPSTYVIVDINPMVTDVMVPLFGYFVGQAPSRREFLSRLLGLTLTEDDIARLLAPTPQPTRSLRHYLEETLRTILERRPLAERQRWYHTQIVGTVERAILPRLRRSASLDALEKAQARWGVTRRPTPRDILDHFLAPETIVDRPPPREETAPAIGGPAFGEFLRFLQEHAAVAWDGLSSDTWLSSEAGYRQFRRLWLGQRFVGMMADLTDPAAMRRLGQWLQQQGKSPVSMVYPSNVEEWVGPERAHRMYDEALRQLPLRDDAIVLTSGYPGRRIRAVAARSLRHFYGYITTRGWTVAPYLLTGVGTASDARSIYDRLLAAIRDYLEEIARLEFDPVAAREPRATRDPVRWGRVLSAADAEHKRFRLFVDHVRTSAPSVAAFTPDEFVAWASTWARQNVPELSTETPYFRAFVWNLVDAGVIRSWPESTTWGPPNRLSPPMVVAQIKALAHENPYVRSAAIDALGPSGARSPEAIPALLELVARRDEWPGLRAAAARAIGAVGPQGRVAIPRLHVMLADEQDAYVREVIFKALESLSRAGLEEATREFLWAVGLAEAA